jgi:cell division transport system permease protein
MPYDLRDLFDQALDDEPVPPPGDTAALAMAQGRRIRRRRGLLVGGSAAVTVVAAVVGLNLMLAPSEPAAEPLTPVAAAMLRAPGAGCTWPVREEASEVSIFLTENVTEAQRTALHQSLKADPRVRGLRFESRQEAYERFRELWKDSPDFVAAVAPDSLPESFRMDLADPATFREIETDFRARSGVGDIVGQVCHGAGK